MCSYYKAGANQEWTRTTNSTVPWGKSRKRPAVSERNCLWVFSFTERREIILVSENWVRFLSKRGKKSAAVHMSHSNSKNREQRHSTRMKLWWCFPRQVWTNHSKVNMLPFCVQLLEILTSVLIPLFSISSPLPFQWPPEEAGGHKGSRFSHVLTGHLLLPPQPPN